jgi:hypothetical protein
VGRLRPALRLLLDAYQYMTDVSGTVAEFAVDRELLHSFHLTPFDLSWLTHRQYLLRMDEPNSPSTRIAFVLTPPGVEFVTTLLGLESARVVPVPPSEPTLRLPMWDTKLRTLRWQNQVVKQFRVPAPNQELILTVFEEEGWPPQIDDPLPRTNGLDPKQRLHDTITSLNRNRKCESLKFSGDGTGSAVRWVAKAS